jgi:hypothetical protein
MIASMPSLISLLTQTQGGEDDMIRGKTLASISANDLQTLVDNQEREDQTIEYKVQLPESNPDGAVKFLSQISSFANTGGGDLVFGIEAVNGIPTKVVGLPGVNVDQEKLRLSQLMQSSLTALFVCLEPLWLSPTRGAGRLNLSEEGYITGPMTGAARSTTTIPSR